MGNSLDPNVALKRQQLETDDPHVIMHKAPECSHIDLKIRAAEGINTTVEIHHMYARCVNVCRGINKKYIMGILLAIVDVRTGSHVCSWH